MKKYIKDTALMNLLIAINDYCETYEWYYLVLDVCKTGIVSFALTGSVELDRLSINHALEFLGDFKAALEFADWFNSLNVYANTEFSRSKRFADFCDCEDYDRNDVFGNGTTEWIRERLAVSEYDLIAEYINMHLINKEDEQ